ncbi:MAG: hypothetical protein IJ503_01545 [Akkermansia sp.]|nr:hypothetical protein [Akkermansia sp.]
MNLRSILRDNRFVGCQNARESVEPFTKDEDKKLTIYAAAVPEGAQLRLRNQHGEVDGSPLTLPPHVTERMEFWNRWASYALDHEYEYTPSLYGLECYAISIAIDMVKHLPDYHIDYCGLPVHDDYALCLHMRKESIPGYAANTRDPHCACPLPPDIEMNSYMKRLLTEAQNKALQLPPNGYRGWGDFDYCCGHLHFDPANQPYTWMEYENSFLVRQDDGFPSWLCQMAEEWEESLLDQYYENMRWSPCTTLFKLQEDALAVDIARYHRPLTPIAMSERFYTGEDILRLADS